MFSFFFWGGGGGTAALGCFPLSNSQLSVLSSSVITTYVQLLCKMLHGINLRKKTNFFNAKLNLHFSKQWFEAVLLTTLFTRGMSIYAKYKYKQ